MIGTTEAELREELTSGRLVEGDNLDFKRELGTSDRARRDFAVDLASMAVAGGTILVGIAEGRPSTLVPVPLAGLRERVEQIARERPDPPVSVRVRELTSKEDPAHGYLVIDIPPSPDAPHAVDGVFRGRRGSTNVRLSADEVRRMHEGTREAVGPPIADLLHDFVAADPIPPDARKLGHLFVIARPLRADPTLLQDAVGATWQDWTARNVTNARRFKDGFDPDFGKTYRQRRVADGWVATSWSEPHKPDERLYEPGVIEVELREDGTIRLYCARATDFYRDTWVVMELIVTSLVRRVVDLAATISADTGFLGDWEFGVAVTKIAGTHSYRLMSRNGFYDSDRGGHVAENYERFHRCGTHQLADTKTVVDRLVGPLNRALNDGHEVFPEYA